MKFSDEQVARYLVLSEKVQLDTLNDAESIELDAMLDANDLLMILKAKARAAIGPE